MPHSYSSSLNSNPPPSYHTVVQNDRNRYIPSHSSPNIRISGSPRGDDSCQTITLIIICLTFLGVGGLVWGLNGHLSSHPNVPSRHPVDPFPPPSVPPNNPEELERIRRQWRLEMDKHQMELNELITKREEERRWYEKEHQRYVREKQQWEVDRRHHEEEQQRWLEERARELGQLWDQPRVNSHCAGYNMREYTATLDPYAACRHAPLMIHGKMVAPSWCEAPSPHRSHEDIIGHWAVDFDEPGCRPHWARWSDEGCVSTWRGYGRRRVESRLWGINSGDSWEQMCMTTPADIYGLHFDRPTRCENRGIFHGMVGIFEWPDQQCGWNFMGNSTEPETSPAA